MPPRAIGVVSARMRKQRGAADGALLQEEAGGRFETGRTLILGSKLDVAAATTARLPRESMYSARAVREMVAAMLGCCAKEGLLARLPVLASLEGFVPIGEQLQLWYTPALYVKGRDDAVVWSVSRAGRARLCFVCPASTTLAQFLVGCFHPAGPCGGADTEGCCIEYSITFGEESDGGALFVRATCGPVMARIGRSLSSDSSLQLLTGRRGSGAAE